MSRSVEVTIHGQAFRLRTEQDEAYMRALEEYVNGVMDDLAKQAGNISKDRMAMMTALQIADAYMQLKGQTEKSQQSLDERLGKMIQQGDALLA